MAELITPLFTYKSVTVERYFSPRYDAILVSKNSALLGTAAAAPPPFRPGNPALCGSHPLVTPY